MSTPHKLSGLGLKNSAVRNPIQAISVLMICLSLSCKNEKSQSLSASSDAVLAVQLLQKSLEPLPELDWQQQLSSGEIVKDELFDSELSTKVLDSFAITRTTGVFEAADQSFKETRYQLKSGLAPFQIGQEDNGLQFPLQLSAQGEVIIVTTHKDLSTARLAGSLNPKDWPLNAKKALALPSYTYVALPVKAAIATETNGSFLSKAWSISQKLRSFVSLSQAASLSATARGALSAEAHWLLEITKLAGTEVRVRLQRHRALEASLAAEAGAGALGDYRFVPYDRIERLLDIKQRYMERYDSTVQKITNLSDKLTKLDLVLPAKLAKVESWVNAKQRPELTEVFYQLKDKGDDLLGLLNFANDTVQAIENRIDTAITARVKEFEKNIDQVIEPVDEKLQRLSRRSLAASASIALESSFSNQVTHENDYIFDLNDKSAQYAFDQAVSGRALWLSKHDDLLKPQTPMLNFIIADRLADSGSNAVQRVATLASKSTSKGLGLRVSGLGAKTGFSETWRDHEVSVKLPSGASENWYSSIWSFDRNQSFLGQQSRENLSSGYLISGADTGTVGSYWFSLKSINKERVEAQTALGNSLNLLGSVGIGAGVHRLFFDDERNVDGFELLVALKPSGVNLIFDSAKVTDKVMWQTLQRVAETFDNQFGLPYNQIGARPAITQSLPEAEQACDVVAKEWGVAYCGFFANKVFERIKALRGATNSVTRMEAFSDFYEAGFLTNKIGARLLLRYLMELIYLVEGDNALQHVALNYRLITEGEIAETLGNASLSIGIDRSVDVMAAFGFYSD